MSALDERIEILHSAGILSDSAVEIVSKLRAMFVKMYGIELTEENASSLVTHFCMALSRNEKKEEIEPMLDLVFEDVEADPSYQAAQLITSDIFTNIIALCDSEKNYICLHVINLLEQVRNSYDKQVVG